MNITRNAAVRCMGGLRSLLAMFMVMAIAGSASAHSMQVEAKVLPFWQIQVESWYETGDVPGNAKVEALRADGSVAAAGRLNDLGILVIEYREAGPLKVVVADGMGHRAETTMPSAPFIKQTAEVLALCLTPPPSLLAGPLLAPPPPSIAVTVTPAVSRETGLPVGKLLLGVVVLLIVAGLLALRRPSPSSVR